MHIRKIIKKNKGFIVAILLLIGFRSAIADWNHVPTGSMKPNIMEGDRIWINKLAYDLKIPFTEFSLKKTGDPKYGDVVVFRSEKMDNRLVKRVIGLPGDEVAMVKNKIILNGQILPYTVDKNVIGSLPLIVDEKLPTGTHAIQISNPHATFTTVSVPADHYLVLGDNRDNSADSRYFGFVHRSKLIGQANFVVVSLDPSNYYLPRKNRFFHSL